MELHAHEVEVGHVVYLVEDTEDGPRRTAWCERTERGFTGHRLGDDVRQTVTPPDDGRRVETTAREVLTPPVGSWRDHAWLVIDTETTGLTDAKVIELGAVVMQHGQVVTHRAGLYDPGKPIEPGAAAVHGITDEMVRGRPRICDRDPRTGRTPAQGLHKLAAEFDCRALVAYNGIRFDLPLLRRELDHDFAALEASIGPTIDPLVLVRMEGVGARWPGKGRHKLTAVAERLGLDGPEPGLKAQAHRAAWDCVLAGRILYHLRHHLPTDEAELRRLMGSEDERQQRELDAYWAGRGKR